VNLATVGKKKLPAGDAGSDDRLLMAIPYVI